MRCAILLLALGAACASGASRPMSEEERTYRAKCASCHKVYEPAAYTAQGWVEVIDKMEAEKKVHLSPEDRARILLFLTGDAQGKPPPGLH
jgi:hypothetical protein